MQQINLHSTMLLLILQNDSANPSDYKIYIPLCFYLYLSIYCDSNSDLVYLHSTMLLLILSPAVAAPLSPADLHSTMLLLIRSRGIRKRSSINIYIPLCFYLYPPGDMYDRLDLHLHSTMLLLIQVVRYLF